MLKRKTKLIGTVCALVMLYPPLHAQISKGDTLFQKAAYFQAIHEYKIGLGATKDTVIVCHIKRQLAQCYAFVQDVKSEEETYKEIIKQCPTNLQDLRYYAKVLQKLGEYAKAKLLYASCYKTDTTDLFSYKNMLFCDTAQIALDRLSDVYLENIVSINTSFDEALNEVNNDTLFFLSSRKNKTTKIKLPSNNQYDYQFYKWWPIKATKQNPVKSFSLSSDGFYCSSTEGNEFYFTQKEPHPTDVGCVRTAIYQVRHSLSPTKPLRFAFDDDSSQYGHPYLSADGNLFFFVSDKPGGYGGTDLYMCKRTSTKWSSPINLGPSVNTAGNELFPCYAGQGVLVFSSNGLAGFGGYDLYATQHKGTWGTPLNLLVPINSKGDDMSLFFDKTKKSFYLSSLRPKGKGSLDIYRVHQFSITDLKTLMER